ncbi:MAG: hypothetical protein ACJ8G2_09805 [Burkholderiales bacterium]|jgi:hypothetical protein
MIRVAAGPAAKMNQLEDDLRAEGYKRVPALSKVAPMEYSKQDVFGDKDWSFTLTWNDAGKTDASPAF